MKSAGRQKMRKTKTIFFHNSVSEMYVDNRAFLFIIYSSSLFFHIFNQENGQR